LAQKNKQIEFCILFSLKFLSFNKISFIEMSRRTVRHSLPTQDIPDAKFFNREFKAQIFLAKLSLQPEYTG